MININLKEQLAGKIEITIQNSGGAKVFEKTVVHTGGVFNQQLNIPPALLPGVYQIKVVLPEKGAKVQKLLISR